MPGSFKEGTRRRARSGEHRIGKALAIGGDQKPASPIPLGPFEQAFRPVPQERPADVLGNTVPIGQEGMHRNPAGAHLAVSSDDSLRNSRVGVSLRCSVVRTEKFLVETRRAEKFQLQSHHRPQIAGLRQLVGPRPEPPGQLIPADLHPGGRNARATPPGRHRSR